MNLDLLHQQQEWRGDKWLTLLPCTSMRSVTARGSLVMGHVGSFCRCLVISLFSKMCPLLVETTGSSGTSPDTVGTCSKSACRSQAFSAVFVLDPKLGQHLEEQHGELV
jgi:hypothetical protein